MRIEEPIAQATFISRSASAAIDCVLLALLIVLLSVLPIYLAHPILNKSAYPGLPQSGLVFLDPLSLWPLLPILVFVPVIYSTFPISRFGGTPGMMMMTIVLVRSDLKRVSYLRAVARYLTSWISALFIFGGYIMAISHSEKMTLHDLVADTVVVKKDSMLAVLGGSPYDLK
ncbi:MAG: RDD family protein [Planctomycetota bacterium]|jgi:uncharacterized RDD family membrane protein YckC|nr:RDD family protein [Planctomycetota bacterium]